MDLRRALPRNSQIGAIKHWLLSSHVIIYNLEDDAELSDDNLAGIPLLSEEGEILANSDALRVRQLAHHLPKLHDTLTKQTRTTIRIIALICDDEGCELELRIFGHLSLIDRHVERVGREDRVLHCRGNIGSAFLTIPIKLQSHEVVEFLCKLEVLECNL